MVEKNYAEKVVVITGASSGFGPPAEEKTGSVFEPEAEGTEVTGGWKKK